jgi:hypothetical protein
LKRLAFHVVAACRRQVSIERERSAMIQFAAIDRGMPPVTAPLMSRTPRSTQPRADRHDPLEQIWRLPTAHPSYPHDGRRRR